MRTITLVGFGRKTTQLGFGCGYILPENSKLLDIAYDAGIRHFDVARSYGRGLTEGCLGRFLKRHASDVTVTTKYGIVPPAIGAIYPLVRKVGKPIVKYLRRSSVADKKISSSIADLTRKAKFTGEEANVSLEKSLKQLRLESVDIFLMHEASADDLTDEGLLRFLEDNIRRGRIGAFGVGGSTERVNALYLTRRPYCGVLQHNWTPFQPIASYPESFQIIYRAFTQSSSVLRLYLEATPGATDSWSSQVGLDIAEPGCLEKLMLRAALELRPHDIVLFSSTTPAHIKQNVEIARDQSLRGPALSFAKLLLAGSTECGTVVRLL